VALAIKKVWLGPWATCEDVHTISIESVGSQDGIDPLSVEDTHFPVNPTPERPLRHVVLLRLLDIEDLISLRDAIDAYLLGLPLLAQEKRLS
jgi:hypothetical protein